MLFSFYRNFFFLHDYSRKNESLRYTAQICFSDVQRIFKKKGLILDVGGATGEFCNIAEKYGKHHCVNLEPHPWSHGKIVAPTVIGVGQNLPFRDDVYDFILCRCLLEHVPSYIRLRILKEIHRIMKKDGVCRIVIPPWHCPQAGHAIAPFHLFPFRLAVFLSNHLLRKNVKAKNLEEMGIFPITFRGMIKLIKICGFRIISCDDELLRNHFLAKIPLIREVLIPDLAFNCVKERLATFQRA